MAKMKYKVRKIEDVDESLRDYYVKVDDFYILQADTRLTTKEKLDEFRNNNITLKEEAEQRVKDFDTLKTEIEGLKKTKSEKVDLKDKSVQEYIDNALSVQKTEMTELKDKLQARADKVIEYERKLRIEKVKTSLQESISKVAVPAKGAMVDITNHGEKVWQLDDNDNLVPRKADGTTMMDDNGNAISMDAWATVFVRERPYLFESNKGTGAQGNEFQGDTTVVSRDSFIDNLKDIASGKTKVAE